MFRPTSAFFMSGLEIIVYKINSNSVMVHELNHYLNENVYIKPKKINGLVGKPYMDLTTTQSYGERH